MRTSDLPQLLTSFLSSFVINKVTFFVGVDHLVHLVFPYENHVYDLPFVDS